MSAVAAPAAGFDRATYQRRVAALLDEIERRRHHLSVLQAGGARLAGLRDLKAEVHALKSELATAVSRAGARRDRISPAAAASRSRSCGRRGRRA